MLFKCLLYKLTNFILEGMQDRIQPSHFQRVVPSLDPKCNKL